MKMRAADLAAAFLFAVLTFQCLSLARSTGQTADETYYSGSGYPMLRHADYRFLGEHPPLAIHLGAIPLIAAGIRFPYAEPVLLPSGAPDLSKTGEKFLYGSGQDPWKILFLERIPIVGLTLLLAVFLYVWARRLYGPAGAAVPLFLFSFDPNILAHGSLYTTDMAVTVFIFAAVFCASLFFRRPGLLRAAMTGVCCGLAMLSKVSGLFILPVLAAAFVFFMFEDLARRPWILKGGAVMAAAAAVVMILGFMDFPQTLHAGRPFLHYLQVLKASWAHSQRYHAYCLGDSWITCDWRYFGGLLLIKTPLLTLCLLIAGCAAWFKLQKTRTEAFLIFFTPFFLLACVSFLNRVHIGLRHVLPVYPFLFLIAGAAVPALQNVPPQIRRILAGILLFEAALMGIRHITFWPDELAYFNEAVGGPEQGALLTLDSNLDWGQDNRRLADLSRRLGNPEIRIAAGAAHPAEYDYAGMHWRWAEKAELENPRPGGYYAVDLLTYLELSRKSGSWLHGRRPDFRAGRTLYLFKAEPSSVRPV